MRAEPKQTQTEPKQSWSEHEPNRSRPGATLLSSSGGGPGGGGGTHGFGDGIAAAGSSGGQEGRAWMAALPLRQFSKTPSTILASIVWPGCSLTVLPSARVQTKSTRRGVLPIFPILGSFS